MASTLLAGLLLLATDVYAYSPHQRWVLKDERLHYKLDQSYCAAVREDKISDGADIILWNCASSGATWTYDGTHFKLKSNPNYCMSIRQGKVGDGSDIILWTCNDPKAQQWEFTSEHIKVKSSPKFWLSIRENKVQDGADLILWSGGSVTGKWAIADRMIQLKADTRFCIGSRGNVKVDGPQGILVSCERGVRQGDFHMKDGMLQSLDNPKYCLVVRQDKFKDNQDIIMWTCLPDHAPHKWEMDAAGHIKSKAHPEFCLMVREPLGRGGFMDNVKGGHTLMIHSCAVHEEEGASLAHSKGLWDAGRAHQDQAWIYDSTSKRLKLKADMLYCATVDQGKIGNGWRVIIWHCADDDDVTSQSKWELKAQEIVLAQDPKYCMSVREDKAGDGSDIILWECAGKPTWVMSSKMISGTQGESDVDTIKYADKPKFTLSVRANRIEDGTDLILWSGQDNPFKWFIDGEQIKLKADPNLCLSVRQDQAADGSDLILWECHSNSRWKVSDGTIRWAANEKYCVSVRQSNVKDTQDFILWTCGDEDGQSFTVKDERIRIMKHPSYCMSVEEGSAGDGSKIQVYTCDTRMKVADEL